MAFDQYLKTHKIELDSLKIEQVDAFLSKFLAPFAAASCRIYRGHLRGFLKYLYHQRHITKTDLALFVVSRRQYASPKPPNFLRPQHIRKLSIFEIKEMHSHDKIESTKHYLHVHIKLMRKVLFDETF